MGKVVKNASKNRPARAKVAMSNADYVVHKTGAWVRLTERPALSRAPRNNAVRRRLAKGK